MFGPISLGITLALSAAVQGAGHDPRTAPTRVRHALYALDGAVGPVAPIGDLDGDGRAELVVESSSTGERRMLTLRAGGSGALLAAFGEIGMHAPDSGPMWDIGPDLDGDGARDVALLVVRKGTAGTVVGLALEVRSGRTTAPLRAAVVLPGQPRALTWISDIDNDGVADIALADPSGTVLTLSGENGQELWRSSGLPERPMVRLQNIGDRTGDRIDDLLLDENGMQARQPIWINGRDGVSFKEALTGEGVFTARGDIDGDGRGDLVVERGMVKLHVSGGTIGWRELSYPGFCDYPAVELLGDIDGDGIAELGVGTTNFNLRDRPDVESGTRVIDLGTISLHELLMVESRPMSMMEEESGCAWVISGKTGEVLMGVYGEPGTTTVGAFIADVGDQDGDGRPDIAVSTGEGVLVFSTASAPAGAPASASADPFDWLPGHWTRETEREGQTHVSEEVWLSPAAGCMLGVARSYERGAASGGSFEFLRIEREAEALVLLAQPGGRPPTRFVATELGPWRVLFTNPAHDFPTRVLYFRLGDELHAHVGTDEEPTAQQFVWRRQVAR